MKKLKILITGSKGLLGSNLCNIYKNKGHIVYATGINKPNFKTCINLKLDITNDKDLEQIKDLNPDLIINCAAIVNIDYCENNKKKADLINTIGPKKLAKLSKDYNIHLIQISTDSVFDGKKCKYSEKDATNPLNYYAKSKLNAEIEIQKIGCLCSIIRTVIYGINYQDKASLSEWVINKLKNNETFHGIKDVFFSPILVNSLANYILELYRIKYDGIINISSSNSVSKLKFARIIAKTFNYDVSLIKECKLIDLNLKTIRPKNISLDSTLLESLLKIKPLTVEKDIKILKQLTDINYRNNLKNNL